MHYTGRTSGWLLSKNAWKKKSNSRLLLSSKTNARIRNDVSAFFAVTTLFRGVETGIPTSAISNASYFAGLYEKWWRIRDAVARTRSERLRHGLSVTIKRAGCRLVINGGAFLKLIGDARPDPHAGAGAVPATSAGPATLRYVFVNPHVRR